MAETLGQQPPIGEGMHPQGGNIALGLSDVATPRLADQLRDRTQPIAELLTQAREAGVHVTEIPVWGADAVSVPQGETGVIATEGLNGCHTTIMAGRNSAGEAMVAMTHFPPDIGSQRYAEAVLGHKVNFEARGVQLDSVVTFVDSRRFPKEVGILEQEFPSARFYSAEYDSRDPSARGVDYGKCAAVLDNSGDRASLVLLTDRGDQVIDIGDEPPQGVAPVDADKPLPKVTINDDQPLATSELRDAPEFRTADPDAELPDVVLRTGVANPRDRVRPTMQRVGIHDGDGAHVGDLNLHQGPNRAWLNDVRIDPERRGERLAVSAYLGVVAATHLNGREIMSDPAGLSADSTRVWESLERRGVAVKTGEIDQHGNPRFVSQRPKS